MAIFMAILGCLCTFLCMASCLHLEHDVLSLDLNLESKERREVNGQRFQDCPEGYVRYENSCFHAARAVANWPEAVTYCQAYGGHLAFIDSAEENGFVTSYIQSVSDSSTDPMHYYWIGGTDALSEDSWFWINTVTPLKFFNWAPDQPDNTHYGPSNRQDCLAIYEKNGLWDDGFCMSRHNFLCEIDLQAE